MTEPVFNRDRTYTTVNAEPPPIPHSPPYTPTADDMPESLQELQNGYDHEIAAIATVVDQLELLPLGAQRRILTYLFDRYLTDAAVPKT